MATDSELVAAGWKLPMGADYIRYGDDVISANARLAAELIESARYWRARPALTQADDLAALTPGIYRVNARSDASALGLPRSRPGILQTSNMTEYARTQTWLTLEDLGTDPGFFIRNRMTDQDWGPWIELATVPDQQAVPLVLTTSVDGYVSHVTQRNSRIPFRLPARSTRWRVHIANRNDANDTGYVVPDLRINRAMYIGLHKFIEGEPTGQFVEAPFPATPTSFDLPDSSEYVGPWMTTPLEANTEYLFSYSYYNPQGAPIASGMATSWWNAATGAANRVDGVDMNKTIKTDLNVWLEVEIDPDVPTLGWLGDSLLVGREATMALHDSPAWLHAMTHGLFPRLYASAGSRMTGWAGAPTSLRWTRWGSLGKSDACVIQLGSNDVFDFANNPADLVSTMTTRLAAIVPLARQHISERIYLSTILPRSNQTYTPAFLAAFNEWNEYLRSLPHGALGCFELGAAVTDPTDATQLRPIYRSADNVHLNTAGYSRMAQAITSPIAVR